MWHCRPRLTAPRCRCGCRTGGSCVCRHRLAPGQVFVATAKRDKPDFFRKPAPGVFWILSALCNGAIRIDSAASVFVGDAAGRGVEYEVKLAFLPHLCYLRVDRDRNAARLYWRTPLNLLVCAHLFAWCRPARRPLVRRPLLRAQRRPALQHARGLPGKPPGTLTAWRRMSMRCGRAAMSRNGGHAVGSCYLALYT